MLQIPRRDLKHRPKLSGPEDYTTVPVGEGVIDWRPIFETAKLTGVRGYYVEQEPPFDPPALTALADSYRYLHALQV